MAKAKETDSHIPFAQWQRHDEASDAYFRAKARSEGTGAQAIVRETNVVQVQNDSGADRLKGHVLEFNDYYLDEANIARGYLWIIGGEPSLANDFGILLQPIKDGKVGDCQLSGVCFALVNVTDAAHKYARVDASTYVLQSAAIGPVRVIYKPSGTGEKGCIVNITHVPDQSFIGKPDGSYTKGDDDMTVELYDKYEGSALNVSLPDCILLVRDVEDTDWVSGTIINGIGHAAPVDCE